MGLFKDRSEAKPAGFDLCLGDEKIRSAYDRAVAGGWEHLDDLFDSREDAWLVGQIFADELSEVLVSTMADWAEAAPSSTSVSMMGLTQVRDAWRYRGFASDSEIDPEVQEQFVTRLELADASLTVARNLDTTAAAPWAAKIVTARDLGKGLKQLHECFDNAHAAEPFRPDACAAMLQATSAKWGGSDEFMFDFARWIEREAPPDAPAREALPMAHLEKAIGSNDNGVKPSSYFVDSAVNHEVADAATSFLDAIGDKAEAMHLGALNTYLVALFPLSRATTALVERIISAIAGRPTPMPWRYYGDDISEGYRVVRKERREIASRFGS
ncbi:MAG: hypothetical protein GY708_10410 [Actinomycetia bacterium]|nr:hypothetical protein [Actinomycetes bacterium]MCP4962384.1 hypothetical protein [Actinomycetes bacterium]